MQPFNFDKPKKIKVTPNQAHKILDKLKIAINENRYKTEEDLTTFSIDKVQIIDTPLNDIEKIIRNEFYENYRYSKITLEYKSDLLSVKESLFGFNIKSKISEKLSKIDILKEQIKYYALFGECTSCTSDTKNIIQKAKSYLESDEDRHSVNISILFYDDKEAKKYILDAKKEILKFEKEITLSNASNEIEIQLHNSSIEYIGLG